MKTKKMEESSFDLDMEAINATEEAKIIDKAEKETEEFGCSEGKSINFSWESC